MGASLKFDSFDYSRPGSGRLQFVLWNSEKYNTSWPAARPASPMRLRNVRDVRSPPMIPTLDLPHQWNSSFVSFSGHIDRFWRKHWDIHEEHVPVKSFTLLAVPALHIEVYALLQEVCRQVSRHSCSLIPLR